MADTILVTYASRTGSTAGVAQAIARTLTDSGAAVTILPMGEVRDVMPYQAVVAGSAIQGGRWLPEALEFVEMHRGALSRKPFAAFLVCMTLALPDAEKYRAHVASWLAPVRALVPPVSEGLFAGTLEIGKIPALFTRLRFRLSVALGVWAEGDHRDWGAIHAWAAEIRPLLES